MIQDNLVNGNIVNEFDDVVGTYRHIMNNRYWVTLYGNKTEMTQKQLKEKLEELDLYTEQTWE